MNFRLRSTGAKLLVTVFFVGKGAFGCSCPSHVSRMVAHSVVLLCRSPVCQRRWHSRSRRLHDVGLPARPVRIGSTSVPPMGALEVATGGGALDMASGANTASGVEFFPLPSKYSRNPAGTRWRRFGLFRSHCPALIGMTCSLLSSRKISARISIASRSASIINPFTLFTVVFVSGS